MNQHNFFKREPIIFIKKFEYQKQASWGIEQANNDAGEQSANRRRENLCDGYVGHQVCERRKSN